MSFCVLCFANYVDSSKAEHWLNMHEFGNVMKYRLQAFWQDTVSDGVPSGDICLLSAMHEYNV